MPRQLSLDDFGYWSPRIVYGLAMRGIVAVTVAVASVDRGLTAISPQREFNRCRLRELPNHLAHLQ
jgi:hypothetical protein